MIMMDHGVDGGERSIDQLASSSGIIIATIEHKVFASLLLHMSKVKEINELKSFYLVI